MQDHLKELLGILYTPGESLKQLTCYVWLLADCEGAAEAVANYSNLFRRPVSTTAARMIGEGSS